MTLLCKDKMLSQSKINFSWFWKIPMLQLWSKLPTENKRSEYVAINHVMQKLSFWKLSKERGFPGKKLKI